MIIAKCKYRHWLPRLIGYAGITLGRTIYFAGEEGTISSKLYKHELQHVRDIRADGLIKFYWLYLFWFARLLCKLRNWGKAYRAIPYEKRAQKAEQRTMQPEDLEALGLYGYRHGLKLVLRHTPKKKGKKK